ncbi:MAG TPA: zf-HC2 domain-containing protein [Gemmatimonadaceae bacterium]|nr:zf-HC2 domain-containing protein [Gemmatimonadaceae bacterium]
MDSRRSECEAIVRRLWPYVDDKLPDSDRERVTRHLEECADCLSHFDFARAFLDAVHAARPPVREDGALRARVIAALNHQGLSI